MDAEALEDIEHFGQRPKLDEYPGYRFMVMFTAVWSKKGRLETDEYDLYLADDYVVTVHERPAPLLDELRKKIEESPEIARGKPDFLTYLVIDAVVDPSFDALQKLDITIDELQAPPGLRLEVRIRAGRPCQTGDRCEVVTDVVD